MANEKLSDMNFPSPGDIDWDNAIVPLVVYGDTTNYVIDPREIVSYNFGSIIAQMVPIAVPVTGAMLVPLSGGDTAGQYCTAQEIANLGYYRERLANNRTYHVSSTGNNNNDGMTLPWRTFQYALNFVANNIDAQGHTVTIAAVDNGPFNESLIIPSCVGFYEESNQLVINFGTAEFSGIINSYYGSVNCTFSGGVYTGNYPIACDNSIMHVQDATFRNENSQVAQALNGGKISLAAITIDAAAMDWIFFVGNRSEISYQGNITFSQNTIVAEACVQAQRLGFINATLTLDGAFAPIGLQYILTGNSLYLNNGANLMGTVAGTTASGGQFATTG